MKKRIYCLLLCTIMLFATSAQVFGQTNEMTVTTEETEVLMTEDVADSLLRYEALSSVSSSLSISTAGKAACTGSAQVRDKTCHIKMEMELLQKVGSKWVEVDSWSETGKPGDSINLSKSVSNLKSGYSYKVTTSVKVYKGTKLIESDSVDSPIKTY